MLTRLKLLYHRQSMRPGPVGLLVNPFYFAECDGCIKLPAWKVFWYGIDGLDEVAHCVAHARDRAPTLAD